MISNSSSNKDASRNQQQKIIENLKTRLRCETKRTINREKQLLKFNNIERSLAEELRATKIEIDFLTEKLEDLKDKISETANQIKYIEIHQVAEKIILESRTNYIEQRKKSFEEMFQKEQDLMKLHKREVREKEAEELQLIKQKELEIVEKNKQVSNEAAIINRECESIEMECAVLKKRNNAIMLKLRRRLVETEEKRRKFTLHNNNNHNDGSREDDNPVAVSLF